MSILRIAKEHGGFSMRKKTIDWDAYILIGPVFILFTFTVLYPAFSTFKLSFYELNGLSKQIPIGFENYKMLFQDRNFLRSLWVTLIWTFASTGLSVGLGWIIALLSGLIPRKSTPYRTAIFLAYGISPVVSGLMWIGIFRQTGGLLNGILEAVGLETLTRAWLGDRDVALAAVLTAFIWIQTGLPLLNIFASIRAIPNSILEAATIDGASPWMLMRKIFVPLSIPGVKVSVFINMLGSLKAFDIILILTDGGPIRSTETLGFFMYKESFLFFKQGYGAAATVVLTLFVLFIAIPLIKERTGGAS